jgi:hypothetical protein
MIRANIVIGLARTDERRAWVARRRRSGVGWRERTDDEVVVVAGVCLREGTT